MSFTERDWTVERNGFTLKGTACLPDAEGRFPVVLILGGSGQVDRNGDVRGRGPSIYAKLAHALAKSDVASYRYDKRGSGVSGGEFLSAGFHDLADDAQACWESLRDAPFSNPDRMYMMGHSEGTAMAAQLSARVTQPPRGLILLCPFAESAEAMLIQQAEQIDRELPNVPGLLGILLRLKNFITGPTAQSIRKLLDRVRTLDGGVVRLGPSRVSARWLRELIDLDIDRLYRSVPCPMLLLSGEKDLQCTPESSARLATLARVPSEHHVVPDMIHHLVCCEGKPLLIDLSDIDALPLAPVLLSHLMQWLARQAPEDRSAVPRKSNPAASTDGAAERRGIET